MEVIISDIPTSKTWKIIQSIHEGWSADKKYYIKDQKGYQYLLRISNGESTEAERHLYNALRELNKKDIPVSKLLDSGLCNQGKHTYRLFNWIEGVEIRKIIDRLSEEEQYKYGYDAGKILRQIHEIDNPSNQFSWSKYYNQKINKKIVAYRNCGITFPKAERIIDYIQQQRVLINGRPLRFHHGDYHIGNMLMTPDKKLGVIDFNRLDFGDPWEEFNRLPWSASQSIGFANGQINGYFNDKIPKDFFELMALYTGVNQIGAIPWAIPYGDKELTTLLNQTNEVLKWYDNFEQPIPKWYHK